MTNLILSNNLFYINIKHKCVMACYAPADFSSVTGNDTHFYFKINAWVTPTSNTNF